MGAKGGTSQILLRNFVAKEAGKSPRRAGDWLFPIVMTTRDVADSTMLPRMLQTTRRLNPIRLLRVGIAWFCAYAMFAHLMLTLAATAAGASGHILPVVAGTGDARTILALDMPLCRPGAAIQDASETDGGSGPQTPHPRLCCGLCALQGMALQVFPDADGLPVPEWRFARAIVPKHQPPFPAFPRLSPPARAPPVA